MDIMCGLGYSGAPNTLPFGVVSNVLGITIVAGRDLPDLKISSKVGPFSYSGNADCAAATTALGGFVIGN
jgi:hypothetical protein